MAPGSVFAKNLHALISNPIWRARHLEMGIPVLIALCKDQLTDGAILGDESDIMSTRKSI